MHKIGNEIVLCNIEDKILLFVDINDFEHTKSETKKGFFFQRGVPPFFFKLLDFTMLLLWIKTFIHCFIYFQSIDVTFFFQRVTSLERAPGGKTKFKSCRPSYWAGVFVV